MKPPLFRYESPGDVPETVAILAELGDEAKVLAGGQSLVPLLNLRLSFPEALVDVSRVPQLAGAERANGKVRLGATVTHARIEDLRVPDASDGLLPRVAHSLGYRAVRNRGTLGGSLVHADPSAEWPVALSALDAKVTAASVRGERQLAVRDLYVHYFTTSLEPDELLVHVDIPVLGAGARWGFHKAARKFGEFADSLAVALVETDPDAVVTAAEVWLGAAAPVPLRLDAVADRVVGRRWGRAEHAAVRAAVANALDPPATAEDRYRVHLHGVAVCRALDDALDGA